MIESLLVLLIVFSMMFTLMASTILLLTWLNFKGFKYCLQKASDWGYSKEDSVELKIRIKCEYELGYLTKKQYNKLIEEWEKLR